MCVAVGYVALPVVTVTAALSVTRRQTRRLSRPAPQTSLGGTKVASLRLHSLLAF